MADACGSGHPEQTSLTTHIVPDLADDRKRFNTLQALAALAGHSLTMGTSGYTLSRWNHSNHYPNISAVESVLQRMG